MIETPCETAGGDTGIGTVPARGAVHWLCLAAAPTFAIMALLTVVFGGGASNALCSGVHEGPALAGMATMYVLMSVFHAAPWFRLVSRRRGDAGRP